MGRKVHPIGFRLGTTEQHRSRWFAEGKEYTNLVAEDRRIRKVVLTALPEAQISRVDIERFPPNQIRVTVHSAKPGVIIGRKGATVNQLRSDLQNATGKRVKLDIAEIEKPEMDAYLVAREHRRPAEPAHLAQAGHEAGRAARAQERRPGLHDPLWRPPGRFRNGACRDRA